jgi:hypothetical protein
MLIVGDDMKTWPRERPLSGKLEPTGDIEIISSFTQGKSGWESRSYRSP